MTQIFAGTEQDALIPWKQRGISGSASEPFLLKLLASSLAVETEEKECYLEENWVSAMKMGWTPNEWNVVLCLYEFLL